MQTAQLRALIQYMLMVKRAKKRLQWAESMEQSGGNIAVSLLKSTRLRQHVEEQRARVMVTEQCGERLKGHREGPASALSS